MRSKVIILTLVGIAVVLTSFRIVSHKPVNFEVPANFPQPIYDVNQNPLTEEAILLGKKLFYEGVLSRDGMVSCGFCHQQPSAFTQHGHVVSHGVNDRVGRRNALPIFNVAWQKTFFWDGGVNHLDFAPINALEDPNEMDESLENVLRKLNASDEYRADFKRAYGVDQITSAEFLKSLSQFMVSMVSANSRYDRYVRKEGETLTIAELEGLQLFQQKCSGCHATDLFTDGSYRNNGIGNDFRLDKGREEITLDTADRGKFRVPTLRNVEYTAPYMHDGRFETLEEVLEHYSSGIQQSETLDSIFYARNRIGFNLSEREKESIIFFLKALTDHTFLKDRRFSEY